MNRKYFVIGSIIFVLIFIGLSIFLLIPRSYVVFQTAPEQVVLLINNKDKRVISNGDTITINPGKYTFTVFRDEFSPYSNTIDIKNGQTVEIVAALAPLTDNAKKLLDNSKSNMVIEKATGINMDIQSGLLNKKYPILKILPQSSPYYRITTCPSEKHPGDKLSIALCIDVVDEGYNAVVYEDMYVLGYNLDDYEIIWTYNSN